MYWLRRNLLKREWRRIQAAWRRGERLTLPLRLPSVFVTGSVGKTTTCRMVEHILAASGLTVGVSTTQGVFLGGRAIRIGDSSNCRYGSRLLLDRRVQAGVFELARGGLLTDGIAFDGCDVAAVLNVYDNHVGLNGVETREQMARVKAQVARAARKLAVLNADDPLCLAMRDSLRADALGLVSMCSRNTALQGHLLQGGMAAYLDRATRQLCLERDGERLCVVNARDVPASFNGRFAPALSNALFAMLIAAGMGIATDTIVAAIRSFDSDARSNPGRMNYREDLPFRLLLTSCDGREAMAGLAALVRQIDVPGRKLLMTYAMGNRPDEYLRAMAGACAGAFDDYLCADAPELRGRAAGETAALLRQGLLEAGVEPACVTSTADHDAALREAFRRVRPGDLLVVQSFYSHRIHELGLLPG